MKFVSTLSPRYLFRRTRGASQQLLRDERGMSTVEYVILLAVIVVAAIGIWKQIGGHVTDNLVEARDELGNL